MAQVTMVLTGDKALNRALKRLAGNDAKKVIRKASRKALKPVHKAARANAPKSSGRMAKAIKIRALARSRQRVGARVTIGEREFTGDTFYGAFSEYGTKHIAAREFMKQAADSQQDKALSIYRKEIGDGIEALAKRA